MIADQLVRLSHVMHDFLSPVIRASRDTEAAKQLLHDIGYAVPDSLTAFERLAPLLDAMDTTVQAVREAVRTGDSAVYAAHLADLALHVSDILGGIASVSEGIESDLAGGGLPTDDETAGTVLRELLDHLFVRFLDRRHPRCHAILRLLGLIEQSYVKEAQAPRVPHLRQRVHWSGLGSLLSDPNAHLRDSYWPDGAAMRYDDFLSAVSDLAASLGLMADFDAPSPDVIASFNDGDDLADYDDLARLDVLRFPFLPFADADVGCMIYPLVDRTSGAVTAAGLGLYAGGEVTFEITDESRLTIDVGTAIMDGLGVVWSRQGGLDLRHQLFTESPSSLLEGNEAHFVVRWDYTPEDDDERPPAVIAAQGSGFRFIKGGLAFGVRHAGEPDVFVEASISGVLSLQVDSEADGFVRRLFPAEATPVPFDVTVGASVRRGPYIDGGSGLEVVLPVHRSIAGVLSLEALHVGIGLDDPVTRAHVGVTAGMSLGPLRAVVERIGLEGELQFPDDRSGNFGPLDVRLGFLPPSGVGLAIDASGISGGGYLGFDRAAGRYTGFAHLRLVDRFELTAVCLLDTKVADIPGGYSLLVSLAFEWSPPLPLVLGFTLMGIGGLIGYNRTIDVDRLRDGVRTGSLDAVLFPRNPMAELPRLVRTLRAVFPPAPDTIVAGPILKLGWGKPTVAEFKLGLIVELPRSSLTSPRRIVIIGQVLVERPKGRPTIRLRLDGLGIIDRERGEVSLDLSLFDSMILGRSLRGDAIYRSKGSGPNPFCGLSVGGFHPAFPVPSGIPRLNRFTVNLTSGDNPRLRFEAYFAVTSNTVQFGARADFYYSKAGFTIEALVGLDVLIDRESDEWLADFALGATVKWRGRTLFGVQLEGTLGGNAVLFVRGRAKVSIWIWSKTFTVDKTLREQPDAALPAPVDPLPELLAALRDGENWTAREPAGAAAVASFAKRTPAGAVLAHPLAALGVRQQVLPLSMGLQRYKGARPRGAGRYEIGRVLVDGEPQSDTDVVEEFFAPGEFLELSDDERLARPSFEKMAAGVSLRPAGVKFGGQTVAADRASVTLGFETVIVDAAAEPARKPEGTHRPSAEAASAGVGLGAVARRHARRPGAAKYRGENRGFSVRPTTYVIGTRSTLETEAAAGTPAEGTTYTAAAQAYDRYLADNPGRRKWVQVTTRANLEDAA